MAEAAEILRFLHIVFAILWAGGGVYREAIVGQVMKKGVEGARFRDTFYARGFHGPYMGITAIGTIAFGLATYFVVGVDAYGGGLSQRVLEAGMGFALIAFFIGLLGHVPSEKKIKPLAEARLAGEPYDEAAYEALMAKELRLNHWSAITVGLAILAMTTFRLFA